MGGPQDNTVSFLGQVIVIIIGRPRSLTIITHHHGAGVPDCSRPQTKQEAIAYEHLEFILMSLTDDLLETMWLPGVAGVRMRRTGMRGS